jgi:hypothetical protein
MPPPREDVLSLLGLTVRRDEARPLIALGPAAAEYCVVPRDDGDADPNRFEIVLQEPAPAM